jgi:hypothetical protein
VTGDGKDGCEEGIGNGPDPYQVQTMRSPHPSPLPEEREPFSTDFRTP